jgi:flagellar P-ring protein precursor FlgI
MRKRATESVTGFLIILLFIFLASETAQPAPRIKDICSIGSGQSRPLVGYGLVIGLDGSGDSKGTQFTVQSVVNMLTRMGPRT